MLRKNCLKICQNVLERERSGLAAFFTFAKHSFALYNKISDIRLIAMLKGIIVCSQLELPSSWLPPVHCEQNTVSQVSQNNSSCPM